MHSAVELGTSAGRPRPLVVEGVVARRAELRAVGLRRHHPVPNPPVGNGLVYLDHDRDRPFKPSRSRGGRLPRVAEPQTGVYVQPLGNCWDRYEFKGCTVVSTSTGESGAYGLGYTGDLLRTPKGALTDELSTHLGQVARTSLGLAR